MLSLLLTGGKYEERYFWENEKNGVIAFYNGANASKYINVHVEDACVRHIFGEGEASFQDGILSVEIPPRSLQILQKESGGRNGVEINGILYEKPVSGGTIISSPDTWAAQFVLCNGKKELIGIFESGEKIMDGDGELRFYRWDNRLCPK